MTMQWNNSTRAIVLGLCLIFIIWSIYTIRSILSPIIIAGLMAYTLNPLVNTTQTRTRLSRKWAVSLVYFTSLALLGLVPGLLAPIALRQARGLSDDLHTMKIQVETALANPIMVAGYPLHFGQILADLLEVTSETLTPAALGALVVLETTSLGLLWLLVILVSIYYFLLDWEHLREWFIRLAPERIQSDMRRLLRDLDLIWRAYLHGTFMLMIVVGLVFTLVWAAIGLPGAVFLGLLAGLLTVIPDLGPAIAAGLAVLVAFFRGSEFLPVSNLSFAILVFGLYFVLSQIKAIWLRPRIMKRFLRLNEGLIFVAIIGATVLWGILGALIIVPLLASIGVIGRYLRCRLLHLEPWPDAVAQQSAPETYPVGNGKQHSNEQEALPLDRWSDSSSLSTRFQKS